MRPLRRGRAPIWGLLAIALLSAPPTARADEASGAWSGVLELRTHYYWETSTRVVAPEVRARLESPEGVRIDASYLVDAITSASIAAGAQEDIRFTEIRNQGSLGISRELHLTDGYLTLGFNGRISHEPDYLAAGVTAFGALALNQRATVLRASFTYIHDQVGAVLRGGEPRVDPSSGRDLSDRGRQGTLEGFTAALTWDQTLTRNATLVAGYQLVANRGFLQNPYRRVPVAGALQPENHPERRLRHTAFARLAYFVEATRSAIHLLGRVYVDDWDILAASPEVLLYQMLGPSVVLRGRYRFYAQTGTFFAPPEDGYVGSETFVTADGKMVPQLSHLVGVQVKLGLSFLAETPLGFLEEAWLDIAFDLWFRQYGVENVGWGRDAVIAQAALRVPF